MALSEQDIAIKQPDILHRLPRITLADYMRSALQRSDIQTGLGKIERGDFSEVGPYWGLVLQHVDYTSGIIPDRFIATVGGGGAAASAPDIVMQGLQAQWEKQEDKTKPLQVVLGIHGALIPDQTWPRHTAEANNLARTFRRPDRIPVWGTQYGNRTSALHPEGPFTLGENIEAHSCAAGGGDPHATREQLRTNIAIVQKQAKEAGIPIEITVFYALPPFDHSTEDQPGWLMFSENIQTQQNAHVHSLDSIMGLLPDEQFGKHEPFPYDIIATDQAMLDVLDGFRQRDQRLTGLFCADPRNAPRIDPINVESMQVLEQAAIPLENARRYPFSGHKEPAIVVTNSEDTRHIALAMLIDDITTRLNTGAVGQMMPMVVNDPRGISEDSRDALLTLARYISAEGYGPDLNTGVISRPRFAATSEEGTLIELVGEEGHRQYGLPIIMRDEQGDIVITRSYTTQPVHRRSRSNPGVFLASSNVQPAIEYFAEQIGNSIKITEERTQEFAQVAPRKGVTRTTVVIPHSISS